MSTDPLNAIPTGSSDRIAMSRQAFCEAIQQLIAQHHDLYDQLNAIRDWFNPLFPDFELYLEDTWNERTPGETHIEYILRSRRTLNETDVLGYDIYLNHRDDNGVWHLDDYIRTVKIWQEPGDLYTFMEANTGR